MNVLIIEDDKRIGHVIQQGLAEDGHQVHTAHDGAVGLSLIESNHFDVAVLDVMLPALDGFSVLSQARSRGFAIPILLLTARDGKADIVRGLDLGADDYLTKPFQLEVLLARVRAVARRGPISQPSTLRAGHCVLERSRRLLVRGDQEITLTKKEFILLELMMRRVNNVVTRDQLIEAGWGFDADVREGSLEFYIHSLRVKLSPGDPTAMIRTMRGLGYMLTAQEHA
ncbi:two-component system, OmpR family, copper resistance phosphate regulon response regulator CusR [Bryocella elongata]|uniref:Two-component system, OmpR family, copper resistance phosphate regulon response regulator CusR n=1 Tax=Bryocella elongata TaxID=863522 RepID=A0A1H5TQD2_9BACT|nr:response regulator transcription factor [Bryocella elongata]SEF65005.1 two-component system, OmpR family, copper resistance phosphate regulon response regulator CusR [Bryocella elongata]